MCHLFGWEALIYEFVLVVDKLRVLLESVFFTGQEFVQFDQPAGIQVFAIWMWAHVDVALILNIFDGVVHVLGCVNFVPLTLFISNLKQIWCSDIRVFTKVSADKRLVSVACVEVANLGITEVNSIDREEFPANSHFLDLGHTECSFYCHP